MWLKHLNPGGGSSLIWNGTEYHWPADSPVCDVPGQLARELIALGTHEPADPPKPAPRPAVKAAPAQDPAPPAAGK